MIPSIIDAISEATWTTTVLDDFPEIELEPTAEMWEEVTDYLADEEWEMDQEGLDDREQFKKDIMQDFKTADRVTRLKRQLACGLICDHISYDRLKLRSKDSFCFPTCHVDDPDVQAACKERVVSKKRKRVLVSPFLPTLPPTESDFLCDIQWIN